MSLRYDDFIESALAAIESLLKADYLLSKRAVGLLLLQGDSEIERQVKEGEGTGYSQIQDVVTRAKSEHSQE